MIAIRFSARGVAMMLALFLAVAASAQAPQEGAATAARDLFVTEGKSLVVDSPVTIERVSVANGTVAEVIAVTPREVLVNGKAPGETSLIIWQQGAIVLSST